MKAAIRPFTLTADLNTGATGLQSAPLTGKRTGDQLSAAEYNRLLELVGQGGGGGGDVELITRTFTDVTPGGGAVKTHTCPDNMKVLSAKELVAPSGHSVCGVRPSTDGRSVSYGGCLSPGSGQQWEVIVVCGKVVGTGGGGAASGNSFEGTTIFRDYKVGMATETHDLATYISQGAQKIAINGHCFGGPSTASYVAYEFLDSQNRGLYTFGGTTSAPITVCASGTTQTGVDASVFSEIPSRATKLVITRQYTGPAPSQEPASTLLILK